MRGRWSFEITVAYQSPNRGNGLTLLTLDGLDIAAAEQRAQTEISGRLYKKGVRSVVVTAQGNLKNGETEMTTAIYQEEHR